MAGFFLGRWIRLGRARIGQGFSGHQTAYIDCPEITTSAAAYTSVSVASSTDTIVVTQASMDTIVTVQSGCED